MRVIPLLLLFGTLSSCSASRDDTRPDMRSFDKNLPDARPMDAGQDMTISGPDATVASDTGAGTGGADVVAVSGSGSVGAYNFSVTLRSPDTGCEQYADWWEMLDANGELLYRRILGHSHVDEQPFTRSGGPVAVDADDTIWVRAHMNPTGYGGTLMRGTPGGAFEIAPQPANWPTVEALPPQPSGCAY